MRTLFLLLALVLGSAGGVMAQGGAETAPAQMPSVTLPPELDRVLRDYERLWTARDAAGLAGLFSADGFVLRMGHPPVRGRAAIEEAYRGSGGPLHLRALAYERADSVGYVIGAFSSAAGQPDGGKFILTLRREGGGRWMITADIDNPSSMPRRMGPPPAAPPAPPSPE